MTISASTMAPPTCVKVWKSPAASARSAEAAASTTVAVSGTAATAKLKPAKANGGSILVV